MELLAHSFGDPEREDPREQTRLSLGESAISQGDTIVPPDSGTESEAIANCLTIKISGSPTADYNRTMTNKFIKSGLTPIQENWEHENQNSINEGGPSRHYQSFQNNAALQFDLE